MKIIFDVICGESTYKIYHLKSWAGARATAHSPGAQYALHRNGDFETPDADPGHISHLRLGDTICTSSKLLHAKQAEHPCGDLLVDSEHQRGR